MGVEKEEEAVEEKEDVLSPAAAALTGGAVVVLVGGRGGRIVSTGASVVVLVGVEVVLADLISLLLSYSGKNVKSGRSSSCPKTPLTNTSTTSKRNIITSDNTCF